MRTVSVSLASVAILASLSWVALLWGAKREAPSGRIGSKRGFGVSLVSEKVAYSREERITMTLTVFNYTKERLTLHFGTAQRYDFLLQDREEKEVWRWSDGKVFATMLGEETVGPGNEEISYRAEHKGELAPGRYKLTGMLVVRDRPFLASVTIAAQ